MNGLWQRAADRMRDELGQVGYETWIGPLNFVAHQGSTITIEAPNRFFRDWINERYLSLMRTALSQEAGGQIEVRLTLGENAASRLRRSAQAMVMQTAMATAMRTVTATARPSRRVARPRSRRAEIGIRA